MRRLLLLQGNRLGASSFSCALIYPITSLLASKGSLGDQADTYVCKGLPCRRREIWKNTQTNTYTAKNDEGHAQGSNNYTHQ